MKKIVLIVTIFIPFCLTYSQCWLKLSADGLHNVALKSNGTIYGWGSSSHGELNTTSMSTITTPTQISPDNNWSSVEAGRYLTIALKNDGSIWGCGYNEYGQIGNGNTNYYQFTFNQIGLANDWAKIFAGTNQNYAIKNNGTLWGWGDNTESELGPGGSSLLPRQITTATDWNFISTGMHHILALKNNGRLWVWGFNNFGQLGDGTTSTRSTPFQLGTDIWQKISAGYYHSMGIKLNGTLWGTGYNFYGGLGDGTTTNKNTYTQIGTDTNWKIISCGVHFSLGIKTDGTLWAWGLNNYGQLGIGTYTNVNVPTQVGNDTDWKSVYAAENHTLASKIDDSIWVWGQNGVGQLGNGTYGTTITKNTPQNISNSSCNFLTTDSFILTESISIYPNPTTDVLNISVSLNTIDLVIIIDALGKEILKQYGNGRSVDVTDLENGLYFVKCISGEKEVLKKFIKI